MSSKQESIISKLLGLASESEVHQKHAAALCSGGKILIMKANSHRSKFGKEIRCSAHSEVACLHSYCQSNYHSHKKKIRRKTNKLTLYIVRFMSSDNHIGSSAPCLNCFEKIKETGVKKLVYFDKYGKIKTIKSNEYSTNFVSSGYRELKRNNIPLNPI